MPSADNSDRLAELIDELAQLTTEATRDCLDLDTLDTVELVRLMNEGDRGVPAAVGDRAAEIARAVDVIVDRFRRGGRLIYLGAGTAGRIGILDASECPPTFGTDPEMVQGLIAGGPTAVMTAVENSEDDDEAAAIELAALGITSDDTVVGISASGRTPYVVGGLSYARTVGAMTIAVAQNRDSAIGRISNIPIEVVVGPEFVAGSTRLKSGTAQKLIVNMLSTLAMVRLGKTYRGVMVDLVATNEKLRARSVRTVMNVTGASAEEAEAALDAASGRVKEALLSLLTGLSPADAIRALDDADGLLRIAVERSATR